jgi:hypothetical protein
MTDRPYQKIAERCFSDNGWTFYGVMGESLGRRCIASIEAAIAQAVLEKDEEITRLKNIISEYESITYLGRNRKP